MLFDAAASLRCWGVAVSIAGREYLIPPLPAGPWLQAIGSNSLRPIVPGLIRGLAADDLIDLMLAGQVRVADLDQAARDAIAEISGMRWWSAARLTGWLIGNWDTLGSAVLSRGLRMDRDPLSAVLVVAYRVILENRNGEAERNKIDLELTMPPRGIPVEEMFDQEAASQAFMALAGGE